MREHDFSPGGGDLLGQYSEHWPQMTDRIHVDVNFVVVAFRNDLDHVIRLLEILVAAAASVGRSGRASLVLNDESLVEAPSSITVVSGHGNVGFARGVELGIQAEPAAYVVVVNPDCLDDVQQFVALMGRLRPGSGVLVPVVVNPAGEVDYWSYENWVFTPGRLIAEYVCRWFLLSSRSEPVPRFVKAPGAFLAIETRIVTEMGCLFDPAFFLYGEDRDLTNRLRKKGIRPTLMRDVRVTHIGGESGKSVSRLVTRGRADGMLRIAFRKYGRLGLVLMAADMIVEALVKDKLRGTKLYNDRRWAISRWAGLSRGLEAPPLDAALLQVD